MKVQNKLKEIRMRNYMMNSRQFCELIDIPPGTYSKLESNKQQGNIETVLKITKALNLRVEDIWYLKD